MTITLHIERLVLDGLPLATHERGPLQAAIEAELTRLLAGQGLGGALAQGGAVPVVAARPIGAASSEPRALGQQIAQAVYGGLNR